MGQKACLVQDDVLESFTGGALLIAFALIVHFEPRLTAAMVLAFALGVVTGPMFITANTIVHVVSDEKMRGKVFSALEIVIHLAFLAAMLVSSWLAEFIPKGWILAGVGMILCAAIGVAGVADEIQPRGIEHGIIAQDRNTWHN